MAEIVRLNALEVEGFVRRAQALLETHLAEARMLQALIAARGGAVSDARLDQLVQVTAARGLSNTTARQRVQVRIFWLRGALEDLGLPRAAITREKGFGYAMPPPMAARIQRLVLGGVGAAA